MRVIITGSEYELADESSKHMWSSKKSGVYGRGLMNNEYDPCYVERTGYLGEMAFGKIMNMKTDFEYREGGQVEDFKLYGKKIDVKTMMYKRDVNYIRKNYSAHLDLRCDIYVMAYIEEEKRYKKEAIVEIIGYITKENILNNCELGKAPKSTGYLSYFVKLDQLIPIENMLNIITKLREKKNEEK